MQAASPDAVFEAITKSGNEVTQGWMRLMASASNAAPWLVELQQTATRLGALQATYFEKQTRLWTSLLGGGEASLASPEAGDRRFSSPEWRDNPYFNYLKQSYLLASSYLEDVVEHAQLEPQAKERARFAVKQ
jgi:polyhydroxyalkanoate synthase